MFTFLPFLITLRIASAASYSFGLTYACKNILLLGKSYLEGQTRPEEFTRKVIKTEKVKKPKKQASKNK